MKKIILSVVLAAVAATSAMAQFSVGAGYLNQTLKTTVSDNTTNAAFQGAYVGADASYYLGLGFSVVPGIYYGYLSSDENLGFSLASVSSSTKNHYIAVPVNFKYGIKPLDVLGVFAYAGPQFSLGISSKTTTTGTVLGASGSSVLDNYGDDGHLNRFNISAGVGLGVELFDVVRVEFGYNYGFLNLSNLDNVTSKASSWHVGAAFLF